jgi:hypothetical protein
MLSWLVYASLGKLLIYLWMSFHLPNWLSKYKFIELLHGCDLCSGVWAYVALAFFLHISILQSWFGFQNVFIVGEIITGCVTSFLVHIFSIGFREKFLNVTVI